MFTKSVWHGFAGQTAFPALNEDVKVDVAIIGGGITGLTAARELSLKGYSVAVLEKSRVGFGTTSYSTGNLYSTVDKHLNSLLSKYKTDTVAKIVEARAFAVQKIEDYVNEFEIDCDFKKVPWYLFSASPESDKIVQDEFEQSKKVAIPVSDAPVDEIPFSVSRAIKSAEQAQFNPLLYIQGFANNIQNKKCRIFEHTHVHEIEENGGLVELKTDKASVRADHLIHATHTPKGIKFVHTLLGPYREYGIAGKIEEAAHPDGIYWGYFDNKEKYSTRRYTRNGESYLMVVGKPHKTGHAESNVKHIRELEDFAIKYFGLKEITFRWSGQHYRPADSLPYIGRDYEGSNIYIATGYSTDGLTYGTLAGYILSDVISGVYNAWSSIFDSTRNQPLKAAKKFLKENLDVAKEFLKYIPGSLDEEELASIAPGEGKVIEQDEGKAAVYKNNEGRISACSAICPHMACIVNWNNAEQTWDCPCHASRFTPEGKLLEGPSLHHLKPISLNKMD